MHRSVYPNVSLTAKDTAAQAKIMTSRTAEAACAGTVGNRVRTRGECVEDARLM